MLRRLLVVGRQSEKDGLHVFPQTINVATQDARTQDDAPTEMRRHGLWEVVRGYYEQVVRSQEDMNRIRQYFLENPLRWSLKREDQEGRMRGAGDSEWGRWVVVRGFAGCPEEAGYKPVPTQDKERDAGMTQEGRAILGVRN